MKKDCKAKSDGMGSNRCNSCGIEWSDHNSDRCPRYSTDTRKILITKVEYMEVQDIQKEVFNRVDPRHVVTNVYPLHGGTETNMMETRGSIVDSAIVDLEYFTGQDNGQFQQVFIGYDESVGGSLGFMFWQFRKQRLAIEEMKIGLDAMRSDLLQSKATVAKLIATEELIKVAPFWRRGVFAITGNAQWLIGD